MLPDTDHRHRRLRRKPFRVANQVAVEDEVADHDDAAGTHPLDELQDAVAGHRWGRRTGAHGRSSGWWVLATPETCFQAGKRGRGASDPGRASPRYL